MKSLTLILTNAAGDELGRLPLEDVVMAAPGEQTLAGTLPGVQMRALYTRVQNAIAGEHMQIAVKPIDFQLVMSRALLEAEEGHDPLIPIPVRTDAPPSTGSTDNKSETLETMGMGDLFDLSGLEEGKDKS